ILMITHDDVGTALLNTVLKLLGGLPLPTIAIPINHDIDPEISCQRLRTIIQNIHNTDGVLILTDVFGATPNNIVLELQNEINVKVITGLNLPMLIKVMNYPDLSLSLLAEKAICGGREGVVNCEEMN
ncbi:MAG: PTS sugar transporter subunit IIA, partial [Gammaproteobacteria bacterium]